MTLSATTRQAAATTPQVTVVMSVYNDERYVSGSVKSILAQTFVDFEFVIVDDGSTDNAGDILGRFATADNRIRLVRQENRGLTRSLNVALSLARGEFIARMDADDVALPDRFQLQVEYLRNHPRCVALGGATVYIDAQGLPIYTSMPRLTHGEIVAQLLNQAGSGIPHPTAMLRRDALLAAGGYREQFVTAQDKDLFLRLSERGCLANLANVVLKYRCHPKSISAAKCRRQLHDAVRAIRDAHRRRGLCMPPGLLESFVAAELTASQRYRLWCELAIKESNWRAARKYAWKAFLKEPVLRRNWWLLCESCCGTRITNSLKSRYRTLRGLGALDAVSSVQGPDAPISSVDSPTRSETLSGARSIE